MISSRDRCGYCHRMNNGLRTAILSKRIAHRFDRGQRINVQVRHFFIEGDTMDLLTVHISTYIDS